MRKNYFIILFISAAALLPFIIISFFNQPTGDDFWCMWMVKRFGFFGAQIEWLSSMNGRYSANIVTSAISLVFLHYGSALVFKLLPVIIIMAWVAAVYHLVNTLLSKRLNFIRKLTIALALVAIYYINIPGVHDGIYWVSSIVCYQLPLIFLVSLASFLIGKDHQLNGLQLAGLFIAILIISGFHEMIAFMLAVLSFAMLLLFRYANKKSLMVYVLALLASGISLLLRVVSIVNRYNDSAAQGDKWSWQKCIATAVKQTGYHMAERCLFSPSFYAGLLFIFFITYRYDDLSYKSSVTLKKNYRWCMACLTVFMIFFPAMLMITVENKLAGMRVINIAYFVFVCFAYISTSVYARTIKIHGDQKIIKWCRRYRAVLLLICCVSILILPGNLYQLILNIRNGAARQYSGEVTHRFAELRSCPTDTCILSCLKNKPYILCPVDVCDDARLLSHLEKVYNKRLIVK